MVRVNFSHDRVDDVPSHADLGCGEVVGDSDTRYATADVGHCGTSATVIGVNATSHGRDVAFCQRHLPTRTPAEPVSVDTSRPTDAFDRTPDDYDVSDHPAYQE